MARGLNATIAALLLATVVATGNGQVTAWRTTAEASAYSRTSTYQETVEYCRRLDQASEWIQATTFGKSAQGRDLPLLVVSREAAFSPEAARRTGKAIVLVQCGIHAGEIDGKEASLALVREIAITHSLEDLLDRVILLVVPIYSADGHERSSPYNRINQNGPESMGWRATAQGLNLNRDYMKADAPETRAMLALLEAWHPHLVIDTHVTDGADYQYDVLYTIESSGLVAPEVGAWVNGDFEPAVSRQMSEAGHITAPFFVLRDDTDPAQGIAGFIFTPRFSNGYFALRNRPLVLVETHMLKPFGTRIRATYDLLVSALRVTNQSAGRLTAAVAAADRAAEKLAGTVVPLRFRISAARRTLLFKGVEYRREQSEVSGGWRVVYGTAPRNLQVVATDQQELIASVVAPAGYVVPAEWHEVIERLQSHGLRLERLPQPTELDVEVYRLSKPRWAPEPFEARHRLDYEVTVARQRRQVPAGAVLVRLDQPGSRLAVHLLEPNGPDSLLSWGFFDAIFEQKESAEAYVLEKLAREMLAADPALRIEFEKKLETDADFRNSIEARLRFFYERSPYWDRRIGEYPVLRVLERQ